jgi:hypothetical protein
MDKNYVHRIAAGLHAGFSFNNAAENVYKVDEYKVEIVVNPLIIIKPPVILEEVHESDCL